MVIILARIIHLPRKQRAGCGCLRMSHANFLSSFYHTISNNPVLKPATCLDWAAWSWGGTFGQHCPKWGGDRRKIGSHCQHCRGWRLILTPCLFLVQEPKDSSIYRSKWLIRTLPITTHFVLTECSPTINPQASDLLPHSASAVHCGTVALLWAVGLPRFVVVTLQRCQVFPLLLSLILIAS